MLDVDEILLNLRRAQISVVHDTIKLDVVFTCARLTEIRTGKNQYHWCIIIQSRLLC